MTFGNVPGGPPQGPQAPRRRPSPLLWVALGIGAMALVCCGGGAIGKLLTDKPDESPRPVAAAPQDQTASTPPPTTSAPTSAAATPSLVPSNAPATSPSSVYYADCDEARAAGAAPIRRGQPGYRPPLDGDNDGVACETSGGGNPGGDPGGGNPGGGGPATDPQFRTCAEARSHGYGPYHRGQDPEYDWYRDADHDGVVCE